MQTAILLVSGKDGKTLQVWLPPPKNNFDMNPGDSKAQIIGDVDRDGVPDLLVPFLRGSWSKTEYGYYCLSGKNPNQTPLFEMSRQWHFPESAALGDVDKDGYPDFYAWEWGTPRGTRKWTTDVFVFSSGKRRFRSSGNGTVSYSKFPQTLTLTIDPEPHPYHRLYLVLGSLTGAYPGIPVGNQIVPVESDFYLAWCLGLPGGGLIRPGAGFLSPNSGQKTLTMTFPRGLPLNLIGQTFYHCYVTIGLQSRRINYASDPVATKIGP